MEMNEPVASDAGHTTPNSECPFCPTPPSCESFKTYPGSAKSEPQLKQAMANPANLESGARPKQGAPNQQQEAARKALPEPPLEHPEFGAYTYEAHHLIPGKERVAPSGENAEEKLVMSGHAIERWIQKGENVDRDSGYSINNSDNGAWLPSAPEMCKKLRGNKPSRPWASEAKAKSDPDALSSDEKTEIARFAMLNGAGQFHYGQHKILDEEGKHYSYPKEVEARLTALEGLVSEWSKVCLCDPEQSRPPKPPFKPTWKMNEMLDRVSKKIDEQIRVWTPARWTYFISSFAKELASDLSNLRSD